MSSLVRRIQIRKMQKMGYEKRPVTLEGITKKVVFDGNGDPVGFHYPTMLVKKQEEQA